MAKRWQQTSQKFGTEEEGTVAVLFGLMSFVLFVTGALAVDFSRVNDMRSGIATAVDAASLAAGRAMLDGKLNDGEIKVLATKYFNEDVKSVKAFGTIGKPDIKIDRDNGTVDIDVASSVKLTLSRVAGYQTMKIPVSSAATYKQKDIEVGMALDITGSMGEVVGGKRKIDALKAAFGRFADRLIPDQKSTGNRVRIGLAPYSAAINLGKYAADVSQRRSKDGCVVERRNGQFTDLAVIPSPFGSTPDPLAFLVKADTKTNLQCPPAVLMPLSDDKTALLASVNSYRLATTTGGHFGVQWAWNVVSDKWGGIWGGASAPDSMSRVQEGKLLKAVVLMTDGEFNTAYHGKSSTEQALALCSAMKAEGIVVFSVAFNAPAEAQKTLKSCASDGSQYYANAANPEQLDAAFNSFAASLTDLRVSR